jgi:hypothetical protein
MVIIFINAEGDILKKGQNRTIDNILNFFFFALTTTTVLLFNPTSMKDEENLSTMSSLRLGGLLFFLPKSFSTKFL